MVGFPKLVIIFLAVNLCVSSTIDDRVNHLSKVISDGLSKASQYQLPTNAEVHRPTDDKVREYGCFDFVVVGGGVTGSVIASRLSEIKKWSVLVLEAGKVPDDEFLQFVSYSAVQVSSEYNWGYKSIPQKTACLGSVNQECWGPLGKGMGGTSLINGGIYHRGSSAVFDNWARITRDPSWSYKNVLPLFKKFEDFYKRNNQTTTDMAYHSTGGELTVEEVVIDEYLTETYIAANKELGYGTVDYNGPSQLGASTQQVYTKNGRRHDAASAFLQKASNRPNLKVLTGSYVTKINIDKFTKSAKGVTFTRDGKTYYVHAKKEVILSAGVFASPRILMSSGIGPKAHLEEVGIVVMENLEVGSFLRDDVDCTDIHFSTNITRSDDTFENQIQHFLNGYGVLASPFRSKSISFYKSGIDESDITDLELIPSFVDLSGLQNSDIRFLLAGIKTVSTGTVRLNSSSPFNFPLIDYNFLSDPEGKDIAAMYEGVKLIFQFTETQSFKKVEAKYKGSVLPACDRYEFLSKDYWYCYLRYSTIAGLHATGTCPMGTHPSKRGAVVNSNLEVFGIRRLRVADASIFPTSMAGHPSVTCMMVGEKLSQIIKKKYKNKMNI